MTPTRREFLLRSATATGLVAASPTAWSGLRLSPSRYRTGSPPPLQPQFVPGVHVYADRESTAPGEVIQFHLSHDRPIQAEICRLGLNVEDPAGDTTLHPFGTIPPHTQPIHPGSYVHVPKRLKGSLTAFTVEAWVRPWRTDRLMGVVSQEDKESSEGWALGIGKDGYVGFYLGDGVSEDDALVHRTPPGVVARGRWHHLVARWDGTEKQVWVDGRNVASWPFRGPLRPGPHPIRLGAMSEKAVTTRLLDGDLAMVVVRSNAAGDEEIERRHGEQGLLPSTDPAVLACWSFAEERGAHVRDVTRHGRHGEIINHGTWMIGGPSFEAGIPRFADYQPGNDPRRGHGLRLLSDDLYDCGWEPTLRWKVPAGVRSGFHVLRLRWEEDGKPHFQHATFVVRRSPRRRAAPILLLAATNTWRAYNASAFGRIQAGARQICGTDGLPNAEGNPPAFSFYRGHAAGPGTYQLGSRLPWPAAGPYLRYGDATDYSHLARADRFTQTWLEREGYDYEVISDLDLHRNPGRLRSHRVFLINSHSEYWSIEMYRGLEEYLGAGGRALALSGNSLFWRVSFNPEGTVMECRKVDAPGDQLRPEQRGEAWHSHDRQRGGMLRECGFPGWRLIDLETLERPDGGNVFNAGSIGSGWALHADARWGRLLKNVLHRFGVQPAR